MAAPVLYFWKNIPFLRLLLPFVAGILFQWYGQFHIILWTLIFVCSIAVIAVFFYLPFFNRFRLAFVNGLFVNLAFISLGALLTWQNDIRNNLQWFGHSYQDSMALLVTLTDPTVEKTKSVKAGAAVSYVLNANKTTPAAGKIIVYFKKDSLLEDLTYGSQIIFKKPLQEIKNAGNPGGFDYKRYSLFHNITHQVYLKPGEFEILSNKRQNSFTRFIHSSREQVLDILRNNIKSGKELGLAEAMLIGYKDDLDQTLVQSYTNTGVVHIIAISGLHLGLIYWLLSLLLKPIRQKKKLKWLSPLLIIAGLWLFSLLSGAQPSILRSALMFTCIVAGEFFDRKPNIYNTLALSAFILLCIDPFWLWDVGFQLSYAAVLSIVIFMRPIYNWLCFKNKILDFLWKLNAVTLAAQILTIPVSIYHFHQFPSYFLLTNLIAVPLSSVILLGEIFLCGISFIPAVAGLAGKLLTWLIWLMNLYIKRVEMIPYSIIDGLQINVIQAILMVIFAACTSYWLAEKKVSGLKTALFVLFCFCALRSYSLVRANSQQKIIVYNVPKKQAIDFINGKKYTFAGDSSLLEDDFERNFHLKPSRVLLRISPAVSLDNFTFSDNYINYYSRHILLLNKTASFSVLPEKPVIDLLVLSGNPKIYISKLTASFTIKQVVIDGSVPLWKAAYWKKDCNRLLIPCHDVSDSGAFVMNL